MKVLTRYAVSVVAVAALVGGGLAVPATASERDSTADVVDAIANVAENVSTPATDALSNAVSFTETPDGLVVESARDARARIVGNTDPAIVVESGNKSVQISGALPGDGSRSADGALVFDDPESYSVVPLAHDDGSVQVTTVLSDASAPTAFQYNLSGDGPLTLTIVEGGGVIVTNANGDYQGAVGAPWAYDATGATVNTWYEVDGSTLVQHVAHTAGDFAYPIVADPWLGGNLFNWITVDTYNGQPRVNLFPSLWGATHWASVSGQVIMNTAGWDEAWNWNATVRSGLNKDSQRQQFECHALGAPFAGVWNLEKFRVNRTVHWSFGVAVHHCNWATANGN